MKHTSVKICNYLTHMCFEVFNKFYSLILPLPKFNVAIATCRNKKFCSAKYRSIHESNTVQENV